MSKAPKFQIHRQIRSKAATSQKGITLVVGIIMLMMITMLVVGAFTLSSTNLKSVGNMQVREEAVAAANHAIEKLISSGNNFYDASGKLSSTVDIDKNGIDDYTVVIEVPFCARAVEVPSAGPQGPSSLGSGLDESPSATWWNTDWDIEATVTDVASGSSITVRQGVRVQLDQTKKVSVCP